MISEQNYNTSDLDDSSGSMAYTQFGYTACPTVASTLTTSQLLMSGSSTTPTSVPATSCCESGRPIMTDPQTGQTICSCQYSSSLLAASTYPRVAGLTADSVYSSAAYTAQGYVPFGTDPSAFYSPLNPAYDLKDGDAWRSLAHPTPCYPYDPTMGGYPYGQSALAQRKNATREATSTLKAWLQEHIKNPYPTKGEKIMLAIITKMTLTQVSTWFANARRRLKKENKMTWSPRNRTDEDGNKIDSDDEDDANSKSDNNNETSQENKEPHDKDDDIDTGRDSAPLNVCVDDASDILSDSRSEHGDKEDTDRLFGGSLGLSPHHGGHTGSHPLSTSPLSVLSNSTSGSSLTSPPTHHPSSCMGPDSTPQKPRIWSLADVATSNNNSRSSLPALPNTSMPQPAHMGPAKLPGGPGLGLNVPDSYNPAFNGFRPWMNGGGEYPSPPPGQQSQLGPTSQPSTTPNSNLLRPYPLTAPRPEVH